MGLAADVERLPVDILAPGAARSGACPRATVALVSLSIRMKPPSARLGAPPPRRDKARTPARRSVVTSATPIALSSSVLRRQLLQRVDVELMLGLRDGRGRRLRAELQPIAAAGHQRLVGHPHDRRLELVGGLRADPWPRRSRRRASNRLRRRQVSVTDWPATASSRSPSSVTIRSTSPSPARRQDPHLVARRDPPAGDLPGKAAEMLVGPVDPLHRHPERLGLVRGAVDRHVFQMLEQGRALVPGHRLAAARRHCRR